MASVTFYGACGVVTGSSTRLTWGSHSALVDCGLYQGDEGLEERNWAAFPFPPQDLGAVLVTHAHLDHTGLLPRLAAEGFSGPIYCTRSSRGLISLVLQDAGRLQEEEARYALKKGYSRHPAPRPLYTTEDVRRVLDQLRPVPFDVEHELFAGVRFRYRRAGHLLGAASIYDSIIHSARSLFLGSNSSRAANHCAGLKVEDRGSGSPIRGLLLGA